MPEHSLEDLKTDSMPALRHAELVSLARRETPNGAYEYALARWPRRQAKAVRFLAILRRDYGNEAFEAFLMEHARPQGTEHAQGANVMTEQSFDHVFPGGLSRVFIVGNRRDGRGLGLYRHNTHGENEYVLLADIQSEHKLTREQMYELVRHVIEQSFKYWEREPKMLHPNYCRSALDAYTVYLPQLMDGTSLTKRLLLLTVRAAGRSNSPRDLICAILEVRDDKGRTLQEVISDLATKIPLKEIVAAWADMLQIRDEQSFISEVNAPFWQGLSIDAPVSTIAQSTIQKWAYRDLEFALKTGCRGHDPKHAMDELGKLLAACDYTWRRSVQFLDEVEGWVVDCLAQGEGSRAAYVLSRFGKLLGYHEGDAAGRREDKVTGHLKRMARGAVDEAEDRGNFGVASALSEYVGNFMEADRLRLAARARGERCQMDWTFYVG